VGKAIWYLPYIVSIVIACAVVRWFWEDGYFILLSLTTLLVLTIIIHWSWTAFIGGQEWYVGEIKDE